MNHTYRLVFNRVLNAWVAVAEIAKSRSKGGRSEALPTSFPRTRESMGPQSAGNAAAFLLRTLAFAVASAFTGHALALPTGGEVSAGSGSISQSGSTMTITQSSQNLALNWSSFSIDKPETVNFVQPNSSAIALNRVLGSSASSIYGKLNANGQVFLLNPNGVLFGKDAQVNVGGLLAGTQSISDADFMARNFRFTGKAGSVVNEGSITAADGGYVALLGGQVSNQGTIVAKLGNVSLAAGSDITLDFAGDKLISVTVNEGTLNALVENKQLIVADGGTVLLTATAADALISSVVNNEGVIQARTVSNQGGVIRLINDIENGEVRVGGTLDASAPDGGNGGEIETRAARVKVAASAKVGTLAPHGSNGTWRISANGFTIAAAGGDLTGAQVSDALTRGNVTVGSARGIDFATSNLVVKDTVTWSANTLTLSAFGDVHLDSTLNASGTAGLALEYGMRRYGGGTEYSYYLSGKVNLASTSSFSTKQGFIGQTISHTILTSLGTEDSSTATDLQGMSNNLDGHYVLANDIDASATKDWNGGAGFTPVGNGSPFFSGTFDGLGHTIRGLVINRPNTDYVGLFGSTWGASIRNVGLVGGSITGHDHVGAIAGHGTGGYAPPNIYLSRDLLVLGCYSTAEVHGNNGVGGLVGKTDRGYVYYSYFDGSVFGNVDVGGLAGYLRGFVYNSYSTGTVVGNSGVGGLIGHNYVGVINNSYSTSMVFGNSDVGGLVGVNDIWSWILQSFWRAGDTYVGIGANYSDRPTEVFAIGGRQMKSAAVFSDAGWDIATTGGSSSIWRMYDGRTFPMLRNFLTPLTVTADSGTKVYDGTTDTTLGVSYSQVPDSTLLGTPIVTAGSRNVGPQKTSASGSMLYSGQDGYDITFVDGVINITPAPLTLTASSTTKVYDGNTDSAGTVSWSGLVPGDTITGLTQSYGSKNALGTGNSIVNVNNGYTLSDGNGGNNYVVVKNSASGTITPKSVTVSGATTVASREYDGTTVAAVSGGSLSEVIANDSVSLIQTGRFADKNVGTEKPVSVAFTLGGADGGNYHLTNPTGTGTADITPRRVTVVGATVASKEYDGSTAATVSGGSLSRMINGDSVSLSQTGSFADKEVGTGKTVGLTFALNGADASNYLLTNPTGIGTADITPKRLATAVAAVLSQPMVPPTTLNIPQPSRTQIVQPSNSTPIAQPSSSTQIASPSSSSQTSGTSSGSSLSSSSPLRDASSLGGSSGSSSLSDASSGGSSSGSSSAGTSSLNGASSGSSSLSDASSSGSSSGSSSSGTSSLNSASSSSDQTDSDGPTSSTQNGNQQLAESGTEKSSNDSSVGFPTIPGFVAPKPAFTIVGIGMKLPDGFSD